MLSHGSIVNFPSITWPSHSTILTGAWCGHHDVVNPTFHLREHRETVPIQGNVFETERYLSRRRRDAVRGVQARRAAPARSQRSIHEPQGRGADHAAFERRIVGDKARLKALTAEMASDVSPRWAADNMPAMTREEIVDIRGMAQVINAVRALRRRRQRARVRRARVRADRRRRPRLRPASRGHCARRSIAPTRRIGAVLEMLRARGLLDSDAVRRHVGPRDGGAARRAQGESGARAASARESRACSPSR